MNLKPDHPKLTPVWQLEESWHRELLDSAESDEREPRRERIRITRAGTGELLKPPAIR